LNRNQKKLFSIKETLDMIENNYLDED